MNFKFTYFSVLSINKNYHFFTNNGNDECIVNCNFMYLKDVV